MAVYEHILTGDRVRPSPGDPYERALKRSPHYKLVDPEDSSEPATETPTPEPSPSAPPPETPKGRGHKT